MLRSGPIGIIGANDSSKPYDFTKDGPPLRVCEVCGARFKDWMVPGEDWKCIPERYHELELCKGDFARLLSEAGHDPTKVVFDRSAWERRFALWEEDKDWPRNHVHIQFLHQLGDIEAVEVMWCVIDRQVGPDLCAVSLWNDSDYTERLRSGTRVLARWDGQSLHGISGRPLLDPVSHPNPQVVGSTILLNYEFLRAHGLNDQEIDTIQAYCDSADAEGRFDPTAVGVLLYGESMVICQTIAEILELLRPGSWQVRLAGETLSPSPAPEQKRTKSSPHRKMKTKRSRRRRNRNSQKSR